MSRPKESLTQKELDGYMDKLITFKLTTDNTLCFDSRYRYIGLVNPYEVTTLCVINRIDCLTETRKPHRFYQWNILIADDIKKGSVKFPSLSEEILWKLHNE